MVAVYNRLMLCFRSYKEIIFDLLNYVEKTSYYVHVLSSDLWESFLLRVYNTRIIH